MAQFLSQFGITAILAFCLFVSVCVGALLIFQIKRRGFAKVAKGYGVVLTLGLAAHLLLNGDALPGQKTTVLESQPETESVAIPATPAEALASLKEIVTPKPANKLDTLEQRLSNQTRTRLSAEELLVKEEPSRSYGDPDQHWFDVLKPYLLGAIGIAIIVFILRAHPNLLTFRRLAALIRLGSDWVRPQRSKDNELGSADFATAKQLKRWLSPSGTLDTILPCADLRGSGGIIVKNGNMVIPIGERNRHVLIVAKTGSGKTTKLILPIVYADCVCPIRSTVIIDSKAEMWHKCAAMTQKLNPEKRLVLFNPLDKYRSLSWNILAKIENDTDCKLIANSVITATDEPSAKQDSPFFRNSALQVLNAMMVALLNDPDDRLSMPRIHELLNLGMLKLCDWIEARPHAIRTTRSFVELARSGSQNADTIMSELSMRIQAWDLTTIRATTAFDEIDIETLVKEPTLFIVELRESELKMLRPLANVIVIELLRYLTKFAEECPGQTLPRPVGLIIDEFASALGRLPDIHVKLNTLRSRNVSVVAAIQSIGQLKGNYGEDWESVLSGFSTKIFMPSLDFMDSEWASKESGTMTIRYRTATKGNNRKITENFSHRNTGSNEAIQQRQVLTPGEVGRPSDNQQTFFLPETPVFQGHLVPYYKIPAMNEFFSKLSKPEQEVKLRTSAIEFEDRLPDPVVKAAEPAAGGPATDGLTDEQVWSALNEMKIKQLDWDNTTGDARKWWEAFEEENKHRIVLVLKVAQEIVKRGASITDFFLAYVYSNTDNIQATLAYLDYTMHMKSAQSA